MRTNVEIDDELMRKALEYSGLPTKKAAIEEALRLYVQMKAQRALMEMAGKVEFFEGYDPEEGDDEHSEW
ncbi:MAG: DUF2191 domain-containing protein [Anaerolinea sp.]|nr:DUF2191 domain-containing protein [Anaerolinea sp.]